MSDGNRAELDDGAAAGRVHLRILATTDLHAAVYPFDYHTDRPVPGSGLSRLTTMIRAARAAVPNSLLLDNGDFLQGTPMGDYAAAERPVPHPVIAAMNAAGYDAGTIGNHEFDYGLPVVEGAVVAAQYPVVLANLVRAEDGRTIFPPWTILDRRVADGAGQAHDLRIGIVGFLPPQVMRWGKRHLDGVAEARDIVETARTVVPEMRAAGADLVIVLCHSGLSAAPYSAGMENAARALAEVPGIDAIVAGHVHKVFPGPDFADCPGADMERGTVSGVPVTMPGFWASHLGVIDLSLEKGAGWRVLGGHGGVLPAEGATDDPEVTGALSAAHAATRAFMDAPAGETAVPLQSYFSLVADDAIAELIGAAQIAFGVETLRGTEHAGLPVLSASAPFKSGGRSGPGFYTDIPAGPLTARHIADLYFYPNDARILRITGAGLRAWLEEAARLFRTVPEGARDAALIDPEFPTHSFDVLKGVTYEINLHGPPGARIRNLCLGGVPVAPGDGLAVVTNNYRADGGGSFPGVSGAEPIWAGPVPCRALLSRHIRAAGRVSPTPPGNWRLTAAPGTSVTFETGTGARAHLDALPAAPMGETPDGHLRLRLEF